MGFFEDLNPSKGVPFMDNRDKADNAMLIGKTLHIEDFAFIDTKNGECPVVIFKEDQDNFYFLNGIIADMLHKVSDGNMRRQLPDHAIRFYKKTNKDGDREYMTFEFVNDDGEEVPF